jgi:phosphoglycolate phosphatase-like HAD superfamily hydrolase
MCTLPVECVVFDCDGVLLQSLDIKTRAFARLAQPFGAEARDMLLYFHARHGGLSRYEKIRWLFEEVLQREAEPALVQELGQRFGALVAEEISHCPLVQGALAVLQRWQGVLPLYVCSGTPQTELRELLAARVLAPYFKGIYGSPPNKASLLRHIVAESALPPEAVVMVGDASTDMHAAEAVGTLFYGVGKDWAGGEQPWGNDLCAFNDWLAARVG